MNKHFGNLPSKFKVEKLFMDEINLFMEDIFEVEH